MSVKTEAVVSVYELDGGEVYTQGVVITLHSHWNDTAGQRVVLEVEGKRYTVTARDLSAAIRAVTTR